MDPKLATDSRATSVSLWKAIIVTGLVAGTLDGLGAVVVYQASPMVIFKVVASGAFGAEKAFSGGNIMVLWGLLFHYIIAFSWSVFFFFMYPVFSFLRKNTYVTGLLYGIFIWIIMNRVVIPLSVVNQKPFDFKAAAIGAAILMIAVGFPIAYLADRYYRRKSAY